MAERRPLVVVSGTVQELPSGDTVVGAGTAMSNVVSTNLTVSADTSVTVQSYLKVQADLRVTGNLRVSG